MAHAWPPQWPMAHEKEALVEGREAYYSLAHEVPAKPVCTCPGRRRGAKTPPQNW